MPAAEPMLLYEEMPVTPDDMVRRIIRNIEAAHTAINAACGYVLHTADHARFICQRDDKFYLAAPCEGDIVTLRTCRSARSMMRRWNDCLHLDDINRQVTISLRQDALHSYINWQQDMLDALYEMGERRMRKEPLLDA
jgi:hypothetical protein